MKAEGSRTAERINASGEGGVMKGKFQPSSLLLHLSSFIAHPFVVTCAIVMMVLTGLPYLFGYLISPADKVFMGLTTGDAAQYMAWMQKFETANLIANPLTPEPSEAVFFNLLWWTLAKVKIILSLSPITTIHLYRVLAIIFFAVVLYEFIGLYLPDPRQRRGAFLLAYFGGGLGWILVIEKYLTGRPDVLFPQDLYTVEANTFQSMLGINHFTLSAGLMTLTYLLFVLSYERRQWRYALLASLAALLLGWEHAYDLLLVYAVMGVFVLILFLRDGFSWPLLLYPLLIGFVSVWAALYSLYITRVFPMWQAVLAQFDNAEAWTPTPFHLLILLGLPFLIVLFTFDGLTPLKERSPRDLFIRTWFGVNFFIVYIPLNFQVHYLNGWQVPIAILATSAFFGRMLPWIQRQPVWQRLAQQWTPARLEQALLAIVLLTIILVNIYALTWRLVVLARLPHAHFLAQDEVAALNWLAEEARPDEVVFSALTVGQYLPSRTGVRPFLAHWAMTKDVFQKERFVKDFFQVETTDRQRQTLLQTFGVDYVFVGVEERLLGDYDPAKATYLTPCFTAPQATLYCVQAD